MRNKPKKEPVGRELFDFLKTPFNDENSKYHTQVSDVLSKLSNNDICSMNRIIIEEQKQIQKQISIFMDALITSLNYLIQILKLDINGLILLLSYLEKKNNVALGRNCSNFKKYRS